MSVQTFGLSAARIAKFKGEILKHATPMEVLSKGGRQVKMPKNSSDTYVARRWLPYGSSAANNGNKFFADGTGDRAAALTAAHLTQEGVTGTPDNIVPQVRLTLMMEVSI